MLASTVRTVVAARGRRAWKLSTISAELLSPSSQTTSITATSRSESSLSSAAFGFFRVILVSSTGWTINLVEDDVNGSPGAPASNQLQDMPRGNMVCSDTPYLYNLSRTTCQETS